MVPTPVSLSTASGQPIETKGQATVEITFPNFRRSFTWTFVIAETVQPLLGMDFLQHFGLSVDCDKMNLIDSLMKYSRYWIAEDGEFC